MERAPPFEEIVWKKRGGVDSQFEVSQRMVAAQPATRRRPGGGDVASGSTAPYVIEGWRQVIVYW